MPRILALACLIALAAGPAAAASRAKCEDMVAHLRAWLDAHPDATGTLPQTEAAQLTHQPTRDSVAKAKMQSRDHLVMLLSSAQARERGGDMAACEATLGEVEQMLQP